jgi:hypothetical protein
MTDNRGHGLLVAMMEPDPSHEEEFNDWYDLEHIPQMSSVPGILSATRWICVAGWPRYLAVYDLEHIDVLASDAYRQATGGHFTPWSRRMLSRVRGWRRIVMAALDGTAGFVSKSAEALDLLFVDGEEDARELAGQFAHSYPVIQTRAFDAPDEGLAAILVEAGALAVLPGAPPPFAQLSQLRWSALCVRYHRSDPFATFRAIDAGAAR